MEKVTKYIVRLFAILFFVVCSFNIEAQGPPPPPGGGSGNGNGSGNSLNGGAPIGNELVILLVLGAAYGGKKLYEFNQRKIPEE